MGEKAKIKEGVDIKIIASAKAQIPRLDDALEEVWEESELNTAKVKSDYGTALVLLDGIGARFIKVYERRALLTLAQGWLEKQKAPVRNKLEKAIRHKGWDDFIKEASVVFLEFGILVQKLEKDLGNMRKARGGLGFEKWNLKLLNLLGIEGERPKGAFKEKLRRIDIVIPNVDVAQEMPDKAFFLSCKRTLRERWKQEVPQARPNQRVYLLTIDEGLAEKKANEINDMGLIAFVRNELKERPELKGKKWIRKLRELPDAVVK